MAERRFFWVGFLMALALSVTVSATPASAEGEWAAEPGALDLDVRPGSTEVWVNGFYVGIVDAFDGFPRYLWLDPGEYRLVFYRSGYRTVAREFTVSSGQVVRVKTRLEKGETVPPETLFEKPTQRAEARIAADRERAGIAGPEGQPPVAEAVQDSSLDLRADPARVFLSIRPEDAAVYLDGRFLGTGRELAALHAGLLIDVGKHALEVVRPGYDARTLDFEAASGQDERIEVDLEPEG